MTAKAPIANDDTGAVTAGQVVSIDLLANDQSFGGGPLDPTSIVLLGAPAGATVDPYGVLSYAPGLYAPTGVTSFSYKVADASGVFSNVAAITVQVAAKAPIANDDAGYVAPGDSVAIDLLANDQAFGGGPLDPTSVVLLGAPAGASVDPYGVLTYVASQYGGDGLVSFAYKVADAEGNLSNVAAILVHVVPGYGAERHIDGATLEAYHAIGCDLDGDGDKDVVTVGAGDGKLSWHENLGLGSFGPRQVIAYGEGELIRVACGDLDGDGDKDLAIASRSKNRIAWFRNLGGGSFGPRIVLAGYAAEASAVHLADIDGDADLDVLATASDDDRVLLFKNLGAGVFTPGQELDDDAGAPSDVTTGDVDGDGDLDVVVASYDDDRVLWYENYGGGLYGPSQVVGSNVDKAASVAVADLDGDGNLDVAAASSAEGGGVRWFKNLGYGSFASGGNVANYDGGANWVEAADLDEDGAVDLVVSSYDQASHVWYRNAGNGSAWSPEVLTAYAAGASSAEPCDLDGDGDLDVLTTSSGANKISWFERLGG